MENTVTKSTARRLDVGTQVTWVVATARGGSATYSGRVLAFIPADEDIGAFRSTYHGGSLLQLKWVTSPARVANADRYVVETAEGCRTVTAGRLEAANPTQK
jgi:hypothetical protein